MARFRWLILLFGVLAFVPFHADGQDTPSNAPYIAYYSDTLHGIVIERADGTDSRVIGQNLMPADHTVIRNLSWSPSGEWLAWTSSPPYEGGIAPAKGWILSADGTHYLDWLKDTNTVVYLLWSPTDDKLLVVDFSSPPNGVNISLIDVAQPRYLAFFANVVTEFSWGDPNSIWSQGGVYVRFIYWDVQYNRDGSIASSQPMLRTLYEDGDYIDTVWTPPTRVGTPTPYIPPTYVSPPELIPSLDGRYAISDRRSQIIETETGRDLTPRRHSGAVGGLCYFTWHPDGEWLFWVEDATWASGGCNLQVASMVHVPSGFQHELNACYAYCSFWLPDHVIPHLSPGQPHSVVAEPIKTLALDETAVAVSWSPDGSRLAAVSTVTYRDWRLSIWNMETETLIYQTSFTDHDECDAWHILPCTLEWRPDGGALAFGNFGTLIWDMERREVTATYEGKFAGWRTDRTPLIEQWGGDYLPLRDWLARFSDPQHIEVIDLSSGEAINTLLIPAQEGGINDLHWTPDGEIVFVYEAVERGRMGTGVWNPSLDTARLFGENPRPYLEIRPSPSASIFVTDGRLNRVSLWNLKTGALIRRINRFANATAFSPDGSLLATASSAGVEFWEVD